jgi:hypothetical protein
VRKNFPRNIAVASNFLVVTEMGTAQKPLIHRHLCIARIFAKKVPCAEIFLPQACGDEAVAQHLRKPDQGSYTQNLVE